jgi:uncharacterized protein DUF2628
MELTPGQVRAFVGPNADYYLERWERMDQQESRALGFNWPAFFGTLGWLVYRRMYLWFWNIVAGLIGCFVVGIIIIGFAYRYRIPVLGALVSIALGLMPLVFWVVFGIYGTYWYYLHAQRQLGRLTTGGQSDVEAIARAGGTDGWAAVLVAAVFGAMAIWARS